MVHSKLKIYNQLCSKLLKLCCGTWHVRKSFYTNVLQNKLGGPSCNKGVEFEESVDPLWERLQEMDGVQELRKFCSKQKTKFTVSVEGNIGCGKTTLLQYYSTCPTVETLKEPVEQWCNIQGHNGLELLYKDSARWSFSFNNYAMLTRLEMHRHKAKRPVKMLERSLYSTQYVFVENSLAENYLTKLEHAVLQEWFEHITGSQGCEVDLFVYLRASPQICYERIKKRARSEEACVPFEFIKRLHDLHEDWLINKTHGVVPGKVLVIDASHELPHMKQVYEEFKDEILCGCT